MILVTVGTHEQPFDRLLEAVGRLGTGEELIVQHGPSKVRPAGAVCSEFLPFEEVTALTRAARVVITHAGVGSIMVSLREGKRPIVMARLHALGEHVDDHQVPLTQRLSESGLVVPVTDADELQAAVVAAPPEVGDALGGGITPLAAELRLLLRRDVGVRPQTVAIAS